MALARLALRSDVVDQVDEGAAEAVVPPDRRGRTADPRLPSSRPSPAHHVPAAARQPHHAKPEQAQRQEQLPEQREGRLRFRLGFGHLNPDVRRLTGRPQCVARQAQRLGAVRL